jgi:hypothetical protein
MNQKEDHQPSNEVLSQDVIKKYSTKYVVNQIQNYSEKPNYPPFNLNFSNISGWQNVGTK